MLDVNIIARTFTSADGTELKAVENLKFQLPQDSFTCIVGPSGCGKTTTLRMILGLDTDYTGDIVKSGNGVVSAVFQEPRLLPWRTVEQNIRLALPPIKKDMPLESLYEALGLTPVRNFYPAELSLGLARRAAIARAFALTPELLVLDEPFVSLDDDTAGRLRELLITVWEANPTTALMVTHNVREAAMLADHILLFSDRPASVVATLAIDTPRAQRDDAEINAIVQRIRESR